MEAINKKMTLVVDRREVDVIKEFYKIMKNVHCTDDEIIDVINSIATENPCTTNEAVDIIFDFS